MFIHHRQNVFAWIFCYNVTDFTRVDVMFTKVYQEFYPYKAIRPFFKIFVELSQQKDGFLEHSIKINHSLSNFRDKDTSHCSNRRTASDKT